jgi:hypothetical protein
VNTIKRILLLEWDAIAGVLAALVAIVLHFLHLAKIDVLLTISTVLVAALFIRHLRRERANNETDAAVRSIQNEVALLIARLDSVRNDLLDLRAGRGRPTVHVYSSRSEVYDAIARVLDRVYEAPGEKQLALAALHGQSGDRLTDESTVLSEFEPFNAAMLKCINAPGSSWRVRHVYNITTEERLRMIEERLEGTASADGFEVRAFWQRHDVPHVAPLVAGPEDVFIGIEDPRYYRVQKAIHVRSREAAEVAMQHFEILWASEHLFVLRSADRVRQDEIQRLRKQIESGGGI